MKFLALALLFSTLSFAAENEKNSKTEIKETINRGANNIDKETRKVIKKGKEVWNRKSKK